MKYNLFNALRSKRHVSEVLKKDIAHFKCDRVEFILLAPYKGKDEYIIGMSTDSISDIYIYDEKDREIIPERDIAFNSRQNETCFPDGGIVPYVMEKIEEGYVICKMSLEFHAYVWECLDIYYDAFMMFSHPQVMEYLKFCMSCGLNYRILESSFDGIYSNMYSRYSPKTELEDDKYAYDPYD